jgi:acetyl esterase/lipase
VIFLVNRYISALILMNIIASLRLIVAVVFWPAFGSFAQPVSSDVPGTAETLPASSPYGEATVIRNIAYVAHSTARQNFDLYLPKHKSDRPFPLIFWIHGGAWMMGIKDWDNVKYLVRHGYAIASIDYRISTEARFPAQIQDCNAALNFILAHATDYGINPKQFVVGGGSAGGHLALLLGLARHEPDFGADPSIKPLAILDFFGPADFNKMLDDLNRIHSQKGIELFQDAVPRLLGAPVDQSSDLPKIASPDTYVSTASPPVLILQGGRDDLVPPAQSRRLHDALDRAGVKNQLIMVDAAGHDGPLFSTPEIESKVIDFLNRVLKNQQPAAGDSPSNKAFLHPAFPVARIFKATADVSPFPQKESPLQSCLTGAAPGTVS